LIGDSSVRLEREDRIGFMRKADGRGVEFIGGSGGREEEEESREATAPVTTTVADERGVRPYHAISRKGPAETEMPMFFFYEERPKGAGSIILNHSG
jgi:hypothetical protein